MFKCDVDYCKFTAKRKDLLEVHVKEKHKKNLKTCKDCGKSMTSSSLSRHKRLKVCLKPIKIHNEDLIPHEKKSIQAVQNSNGSSVVDVKKVRIETEISVAVHSDGKFTIGHDGIQIGDLTYYLTTQKPEGESVFKCVMKDLNFKF